MPAIGELHELITIIRGAGPSDDAGGRATKWIEVAKVWANVQIVRPEEVNFNEQIVDRAVYVFTIRFFPGLRSTMRIKYDDGNGEQIYRMYPAGAVAGKRRHFQTIKALLIVEADEDADPGE